MLVSAKTCSQTTLARKLFTKGQMGKKEKLFFPQHNFFIKKGRCCQYLFSLLVKPHKGNVSSLSQPAKPPQPLFNQVGCEHTFRFLNFWDIGSVFYNLHLPQESQILPPFLTFYFLAGLPKQPANPFLRAAIGSVSELISQEGADSEAKQQLIDLAIVLQASQSDAASSHNAYFDAFFTLAHLLILSSQFAVQ